MRFLFRGLIFFLLVGCGHASAAVTYYWYYGSFSGPTPDFVVRAYVTATWGSSQTFYWQSKPSASDWVFGVDGKSYDNHVLRLGDSCPAGQTLDPVTGGCKLPPEDIGKKCSETPAADGFRKIINTAGECVLFSMADEPSRCKSLSDDGGKFISLIVPFDQDGNPQSPPNPEYFQCKVKVLDASHCKLPAGRSSGGVTLAPAQAATCRLYATFTGEVAGPGIASTTPANPATGEPGVCPEGSDCTVPDAPKVEEKQPCNYVEDGEGRKVCSSSNYEGTPGQQDCGTVNGQFKCITKPAKSNGLQIATVVDTQTNGDGTKTITKTDTATQTKCIGANACTTTVTKNTTVVKQGADGSTQSTSSSCTGANCATSTNPDGDGDGLGDCVGKDCGTDEDGNPTTSPDGPELEEVPGFGDTTQAFMDRVRNAPLLSAVQGISFPAGGTCPTGSASTFFGSISFDSFCQLAPNVLGPLRYLFLAIWAWAAIRLFFTA
ncbi:hypothetical protein D9M68_328040 [compost metagenome]